MSLKTRYLAAAAIRVVLRYRLRSALIITCAALGVAGTITSVNYASAGRQQVLDQIRRMGINTITVTAQQSSVVAGRARTGAIVTTLREPDYAALRRDLPERVAASALLRQSFRLKAGDFSKTATIVGCEPAYFAIREWKAERGEPFDAADLRRSARVAVIGRTIATDLYGGESAVGRRLFINRVPFEVVAVLTERGQGLDLANEDDQVFIPLTTAMRRLTNVEYFSSLLFEIGDWNEMARSAGVIADIMRARHRAPAGQREDFQVQNQKSLVETQIAASARLRFLVRWIGASCLVVSGLGILAIAWIAAKDRTAEVGTRRALGATVPDVFVQFVVEALLLSAIGSVTGLWLGQVASRLVTSWSRLPAVFEFVAAAVAVWTALLLNLTFATWPAWRAAKLDPIEALKHE